MIRSRTQVHLQGSLNIKATKKIKDTVSPNKIGFTLSLSQTFYCIIDAFQGIPLDQCRGHYALVSLECPFLTAELKAKQAGLYLRAHILGLPPIGTHYSILLYNLYMVPRNTNIRASQPEGLLVSFS